MILHPGITGVVLAGGLATRLAGRNKALLAAGPQPQARSFLEGQLAIFAGRFAGCVLVLAPSADPEVYRGLPVSIACDRTEGCGPLSGIDAGLRATRTPWAFVCGCDMPRLSVELIAFMAERARDGRALVPMRAGRPEPLHALYPTACAGTARTCLDEGVRTIRDFLDRIPVDYLAEQEFASVPGATHSFDNINTQDDLDRYWRDSAGGTV